MKKELGLKQLAKIDELVNHYVSNKGLFTRTLINLEGYINDSDKLKPLVHSVKSRTKKPDHLKEKLIRKAKESLQKGEEFGINKENLFTAINDLAGFRILHLHTRQIKEIDEELKKIFSEEKWEIIEGPLARTWDDESRDYFTSIGIGIKPSPNPNMYTSIHYVIQPNPKITCELQVRTLMEEVWGEVDHTINYPHKTGSLSCSEQIKALARATSSCSRLVDSIFASHNDYELSKFEIDKSKEKGKPKASNTKKVKKK